MNIPFIKRRPLVALISLLLANAGWAVVPDITDAVSPGSTKPQHSFSVDRTLVAAPHYPGRYIVRFAEPAAPAYFQNLAATGGSVLRTAYQKTGARGRTHLDAKDASVRQYAEYLQDRQMAHVSEISGVLGRSPSVVRATQFALNAIVLDGLTDAEANTISTLSGVDAVTPDALVYTATDRGPGFIGASSVWFGTHAAQDSFFASGFENGSGYRGDGVVIGVIDTGYNSLSPSFSAIDASGYVIQNPFGPGNFIGQCTVPNISLAGCNDKVIGVYDFTKSGILSVEDSATDGHGSHTGSTAGGNARSVTLDGFSAQISGVAPHANIVVYRALRNGAGLTSAMVAAIDQTIQDGIVDVLSFSVSGGADPWNDPSSLAFLSATESGVFVAAAAGNISTRVPVAVPGSADHLEPWVLTVAASSHGGGSLVNPLNINGPGVPPTPLLFGNFSGTAYAGFSTAIENAPVVLSPQFDNTTLDGTDGCSSYASNQFANAIAVIARGTCAIADKVAHAASAGAVAVVLSDNRVEDPTQILFGLGDTPIAIPVFSVVQADGTALQTYLSSNGGVSGGIPTETERYPMASDVLAGFSLLGPSTVDVIKPDVQAPGIAILASFSNDGSADGANRVAFSNGTSMATPHVAGAGALLLGLHPDWTPMEIKSALMMTSKGTDLFKQPEYPQLIPSGFFDRGSGRIQVFPASKAGLVLNESGLNFSYANPANADHPTYVQPSALNLASMQTSSCVTVANDRLSSAANCTFTRSFRNTQDHPVTWTPSFTGDISATTTPSTFTATDVARQRLQIHVDAAGYNADGNFHFGEMVLTPNDPELTALRLPMAIKVPPPAIVTDQTALTVAIAPGQTRKIVNMNVRNAGGPILQVSATNSTTSQTYSTLIDQAVKDQLVFVNYWEDQGHGLYAADDFTTSKPITNLSRLSFPGAATSDLGVTHVGREIHFEIYADNAGKPNGNPETVAPSYLWNYVATIGETAGLSVAGNSISLDLAAAPGVMPANLVPGRYWMVAYVDSPTFLNGLSAQGWLWSQSGVSGDANAHLIDPAQLFDGTPSDWGDMVLLGGGPGMAMNIAETAPCGAPWLTTAPSTLTISASLSKPMNVTINSTNFPPGQSTASAFLCITSNDPQQPIYRVPVTATQN